MKKVSQSITDLIIGGGLIYQATDLGVQLEAYLGSSHLWTNIFRGVGILAVTSSLLTIHSAVRAFFRPAQPANLRETYQRRFTELQRLLDSAPHPEPTLNRVNYNTINPLSLNLEDINSYPLEQIYITRSNHGLVINEYARYLMARGISPASFINPYTNQRLSEEEFIELSAYPIIKEIIRLASLQRAITQNLSFSRPVLFRSQRQSPRLAEQRQRQAQIVQPNTHHQRPNPEPNRRRRMV